MDQKKKPVIGVSPLYDETKESIWMLPGYLEGLLEVGAIPVILPLTAQKEDYEYLDAQFDGYLLTGGHDIDPALYGEEKSENCGAPCAMRDTIEPYLYHMAVAEDKPVLGICRGIQLINVLEGGTLYQDLPSEYKTTVEHHMSAPYDRVEHKVDIKMDSPLYDLVKKEKLRVNSYHHQAVRTLGEKLVSMAVSEDGLVEAVYRPDLKFVWGVQWHPEFLYRKDADAKKIFQAFVDACGTDGGGLYDRGWTDGGILYSSPE